MNQTSGWLQIQLAIFGIPHINSLETCHSIQQSLQERKDIRYNIMPYEYHVLPSKDGIRLLHLYPSQNPSVPDGEEVPYCKLEQYELYYASRPPYEVLSYSWGSPRRDTFINCDGFKLFVTQNCRHALQQLSRLIDEPKVLWVDAICIDQEDIVERSAQVCRMHDIFGQAERVIIWLGKADDTSDRCLTSLRTLGKENTIQKTVGRLVPKKSQSSLNNMFKVSLIPIMLLWRMAHLKPVETLRI
jgi:hypothetical protein